MKKKLIFLCFVVFIGYVLLFPKEAVGAAAGGLMLWYEKVLPTLLPFAILSNILIYSNYLQYFTRILTPLLRPLFRVSGSGAFVLISGFLFGFPMGSKNCAELLKNNLISAEEADVLFVISNNISPIFVSSYILCQQLAMPELIAVSYLILYGPPLLAGAFLLRRNDAAASRIKIPASGSQMNFKIIDAGIMNGFDTLVRLGGYIMLFGMMAQLLQKLPLPVGSRLFVTGAAELTNGISFLSAFPCPPRTKYILAMAFTAFGGLSGIAQTSSMVRDTGLSMRRYCLLKGIFTLISAALAVLVTYISTFPG